MVVRVKSGDTPPENKPLPWFVSNGSPQGVDLSDEQIYYTGEGIGAIGAGLKNFSLDTKRNLNNFSESVANFFSGKPQAAEGEGRGNQLYGIGQQPVYQRGVGPRRTGEKPQPERPMTLADYLLQASQLVDEYGGGGPDYSAAAEALRQQALQSDAKLNAMYQQLRQSYQNDAPTIQGQFQQGIQSINQNADQAAGNTSAAYQEARDAQSRQLEALGIEDAAAVLASQGGNAAADQAHAIGNIEQGRATGTNQLAQGQTAALNYNTNIGNAASLGGAEARSALARQLQSALADIAVRQSEAGQSRGRSVLDLAFQLQGQDAGNAQALAEFLYGQQQDQSNAAVSAQEAARSTFLRLVEQYDGDMQKAAEAFAQLQAAGLV